MGSGAALEFAERVVDRLGRRVGARGEHRVEGVADGDDACAEWDFDAGERVGVAAAVPCFVRGAHEAGGGAERGRGGEDAFADQGMAAHEHPFLVGQGSGFGDDGVRDRDLADVVQRGGLV